RADLRFAQPKRVTYSGIWRTDNRDDIHILDWFAGVVKNLAAGGMAGSQLDLDFLIAARGDRQKFRCKLARQDGDQVGFVRHSKPESTFLVCLRLDSADVWHVAPTDHDTSHRLSIGPADGPGNDPEFLVIRRVRPVSWLPTQAKIEDQLPAIGRNI